jgi:hypothetical protein
MAIVNLIAIDLAHCLLFSMAIVNLPLVDLAHSFYFFSGFVNLIAIGLAHCLLFSMAFVNLPLVDLGEGRGCENCSDTNRLIPILQQHKPPGLQFTAIATAQLN